MAKEKPDKAQAERFIEKAKELGADESGETFERAIEKVAPPKRGGASPKKPGRPARVYKSAKL